MISAMRQVQIAVPRIERDRFLGWLQEQTVLHVTPLDQITPHSAVEDTSTTGYQLAQVQFALEFVRRLKLELEIQEKRDWRRLFAPKPEATVVELEAILNRLKFDELMGRFRTISDALGEVAAEQTRIAQELAVLMPWKQLTITQEQLLEPKRVHHVLVSASLTEEERLVALLTAIPTATWQVVSRISHKKQGTLYLEIIAELRDSGAVHEALGACNAEPLSLPLQDGETPALAIERYQDQQKAVKAHENELMVGARELVLLELDLKLTYDALLHRLEREAQHAASFSRQFIFMISGWVPETAVKNFESQLMSVFSTATLAIAPKSAVLAPVLFANHAALQPFEVVTNIYGKPRADELDPSPLLAVFFLLAFGLALTDAGYGIVLMVTMGAADRFFKLKREMRKMVRLLFYAGAATLVLGAVTGGWFGITLEELPESGLRDALLAVKLLDPIKSPMLLLMIAFALGIVQLLFAWGIKGYDLWRRGDRFGAIFDGGAWITMVLAILFWSGVKLGYFSSDFGRLALAAVTLNAGALILTQGRHYKNIFLRLGAGVMSLYGLIGFVSDVLSYSRLLALGLATGIIGLVVNLISGMVIEMIPVVGIFIAIVVLLVGHIFNLGINSLGAFIHAGRLQFVEFFPKFLEGGGVAYKPFGRVSKYVDNPKDYV